MSELQTKFPYLLELYGKSLEEQGELSALSVDEIQTMDETDIMKKFFAENFAYEPDEEQMKLFREVLEACEKEGDLS